MKEDFLKSWNMMSNEMQKSLESMIELHVKTLQSLKFLHPEELSHFKQPSEFLGKQMSLAMENGQTLLDCMHQSFQIMEGALFSSSKEIREVKDQLIKKRSESTQKQEKPLKTRQSKASPLVAKVAQSATAKPKKNSMKSQLENAEVKQKAALSKKKASTVELKPTTSAKKKVTLNKSEKSNKAGAKNKMTLLERKMGMPEPKSNLLVSSSINDNLTDIPESKINQLDSHLPEHPMTEQAGKGKNPFQK